MTNLKRLLSAILTVTVMVCGLAVTSPAMLHDRGNGLIYDDVLNITWLQDAYLANRGFTWNNALSWANNLEYAGYNDWRPTTVNELNYMFYNNLGGTLSVPLIGNQGLFINIQSVYWTPDQWANDPGNRAVGYCFAYNDEFAGCYAGKTGVATHDWGFGYPAWAAEWAVRDGDVTVVPEPISSILFVMGGTLLAGRRLLKRGRS